MKGLLAAALMVLGLLLVVKPASAQVTILNEYYEDIGGMGVCAPSDTCVPSFQTFPASTAGKYITLTEVSCDLMTFSTFGSSTPYLMRVYVEVSDAGLNLRRRHSVTASGRTGPQSFTMPLNIKILGGPPRRPVVTLKANTTAGFGGQCTVVGKITTS